MTDSGHPIGRGLSGRVAALRNRLARIRYFRGHGVHSPFVYGIVRGVFMRRTLLPGDRELFGLLLAEGVSKRRAVQLQNLAIHCGFQTYGLDRADMQLCVVTPKLLPTEIQTLLLTAAAAGNTVAVLSPYNDRERQDLCRKVVAEHGSTTVDNRGYLLIFNNYLPKQHFRI